METYEQLHTLDRNKKHKVVFKTEIWEQFATEYELHNLTPASLYFVQVKMFFITNQKQGNYEVLLGLKEDQDFNLPPITSTKVEIQTKQRYVSDFMHQELNKARLSMRPVSKNIPFVKSERALGDIAR